MSLSTAIWYWCPECHSWLSGDAIREHNRAGRWNDLCPGTPIDLVVEREQLLALIESYRNVHCDCCEIGYIEKAAERTQSMGG